MVSSEITIRQTDSLTADEDHQLFEWGENIFGDDLFDIQWRPKEVHFLLSVGGELVSHVGALKHPIKLDQRLLIVGGVGGVVTIPSAQRQGYASQLLRHVVQVFQQEWQVEAGILFCSPAKQAFYESLGWQPVTCPVWVEQPKGRMVSRLPVMIMPFQSIEISSVGLLDLQSQPW
ncbi:MAG: GNAT family N-acetyltransferase [Synechococcaceae cyanobacterium SM2_3_2]|nr:GNAT family N-acetyltransferase [Synechococcaceae cyanobacterium SM2_3_2]